MIPYLRAALAALMPLLAHAAEPPLLGVATTVEDVGSDTSASIEIFSVSVAINFKDGPGLPRDFIGLYDKGAPNNQLKDWRYVACDGQTCPTATAKSGTVHLPIKSPRDAKVSLRYMSVVSPGVYELVK